MEEVIAQKKRLVMKFGGTSVQDMPHIRRAADKVIREVQNGYHVCVVVSAMAGVTNRLVEEATSKGYKDIDPNYSAIVSEGELERSSLMAKVLNERGYGAQAWSGPQIPVRCDNNYGRSRILDIPSGNLDEGFSKNQIAVVAGFQGISQDGRITTLGRGGSDTTAVALAVALEAERCDIYTDVDGVYSADPRVVKTASKIDRLGFEEMFEMAGLGSKVLHVRSVELGLKYNVPIQVLSSLNDNIGSDLKGTLIMNGMEDLEGASVTGIAHDVNQAQVTAFNLPDEPGQLSKLFNPLAAEGINKDMIAQTVSRSDRHKTDITFTVAKNDLERVETMLNAQGYRIETDSDVVKVSAVGAGMVSDPNVSSKFFDAMAGAGVNMRAVTTSEIKISVLVRTENADKAVSALHSAFGLDRR